MVQGSSETIPSSKHERVESRQEIAIKLKPPYTGPCKTRRLGHHLTAEDIELSIERWVSRCLLSGIERINSTISKTVYCTIDPDMIFATPRVKRLQGIK